jgi:uracil-DNA glycosylase family 4
MLFDPNCRLCPRLSAFLDDVKRSYPVYHARPVPPFGDEKPRLLIIGLAPGMHGANRSGRPFTGDYAGILLYRTLHKYGFANRPESISADDGLRLIDCRITNAVKCLPPQNKPDTSEIILCNNYLKSEIKVLHEDISILVLGTVAHDACLRALDLKRKDFPFAHGAIHRLPGGRALHDSYHCSRYNTQTRRLSAEMFESVFASIRARLTT